MASDRKKVAPVKSTRSHFQKAAFWAILGVVTTLYTTAADDGFSKLSFLQVVFFFSSVKSLMKGFKSSNSATPLPAQKPHRAVIARRIPVPRTAPDSAPHLATNPVESMGHRWRGAARRNWYWVALFLVLWQVFERI